MNKECPKCGRFTVKLDSYFNRERCMMRDCSWISTQFNHNQSVPPPLSKVPSSSTVAGRQPSEPYTH
jgi:hypothetical protein